MLVVLPLHLTPTEEARMLVASGPEELHQGCVLAISIAEHTQQYC